MLHYYFTQIEDAVIFNRKWLNIDTRIMMSYDVGTYTCSPIRWGDSRTWIAAFSSRSIFHVD